MPNFWLLPKGGAVPDLIPNAFSFTPLTGQALGAVCTGAPTTITGITAPAPFTCDAGFTVQINGAGSFLSSGSVNNLDTLTPRTTSSTSNLATVAPSISVNGVTATFSVTTVAAAGGEPAGWVDNPLLNFIGKCVNLSTEAAIGGNFATFNTYRTSMRYDNFLYPLGGLADYGWGMQQLVDYIRGGSVTTDWRNDAFAYMDTIHSTYVAGGYWAGEHRWLSLDLAIGYLYGAPNAANYLATLRRMTDEAEHWRARNETYPDSPSYYNMRVVTRSLQQWISFKWSGAATSLGSDYPAINQATALARIQEGLSKLQATQMATTGGWILDTTYTSLTHWYHCALALWTLKIADNNSYIDHTTFVTMVKKFLEGYWAFRWQQDANGSSTTFISGYSAAGPWEGASPDLDGCFIDIHYWLAWQIGDDTFVTRGDLLLANTLVRGYYTPNTYDSARKNYDYLMAMGGISYAYDRIKAVAAVQLTGRPKCTVAPVITDIGGGVLSCSDGTWVGSPTSFTRRWLYAKLGEAAGCGVFVIAGATAATYNRTGLDAQHIWCEVSPVKAGFTGLNSGAPATTTWFYMGTVVFPLAPINIDSLNDWAAAGDTVRLLIPASQLAMDANSINVTFYGSGSPMVCSKASIGMQAASGDAWDYSATPVPILFSGAAGFTVPGGDGLITSDTVALAIDKTKNYIIAFRITSYTNMRVRLGAGAGFKSWVKAGDDVMTVNASGYSVLRPDGDHYLIHQINKVT